MASDVQPLTRAELREELDRTLQHYATKADVANMKVWLVSVVGVATSIIVGVMRFVE